MTNNIENKLDSLGVLPGDLVFMHTSFSRIKHLSINPEDLIKRIISYLGKKSTLVMPRYAWNLYPDHRPWKGYEVYINNKPVLDLVNTPCNIGIIPEVFRKMENVYHSNSYFWPLCATGYLAKDVISDQENIIHPYGEGSSYEFLHKNDAKILGLGVTLNTTSLCPIVDYELNGKCAKKVFTEEPIKGTIIDLNGMKINTESFTLRPEVVKLIRPSALFELGLENNINVKIKKEDGIIYFCYPYKVYHNAAVEIGKKSLNANKSVPWLKELER